MARRGRIRAVAPTGAMIAQRWCGWPACVAGLARLLARAARHRPDANAYPRARGRPCRQITEARAALLGEKLTHVVCR